ncbi:MAG TPA: hypothetical protein ENF62_02365 [Candidatus Bathyarchaeota archaeon]|nr:hypothetical protein [Candidatus Bathyarchaeota archaeon]
MKIEVYSAKQRTVEDLAWCALCHGKEFIYWVDGYLLCYEGSFEAKDSRLCVTDCCIAQKPNYEKGIKVEGVGTIPSATLPVARASATAEKILKEAQKLLGNPA